MSTSRKVPSLPPALLEKAAAVMGQTSAAIEKKKSPSAEKTLLAQEALAACGLSVIHRDIAIRILSQVIALFPEGPQAFMDAAAWLAELKPRNVTEAMLAAQMVAVHDAAMKFLRRAAGDNTTTEITERNVLQASRLMRVFAEQIQAMRSCKGESGRQQMTVKHIHVNAGGRAIVGPVRIKQDRNRK